MRSRAVFQEIVKSYSLALAVDRGFFIFLLDSLRATLLWSISSQSRDFLVMALPKLVQLGRLSSRVLVLGESEVSPPSVGSRGSRFVLGARQLVEERNLETPYQV